MVKVAAGDITKIEFRGFTIVELLLVIVTIGILSGIALVFYSGISQRAVVASIQSDLSNVSQQIKIFQINNGTFPLTTNCSIPDSSTNQCLRVTNGNSYSYQADNYSVPQTYCITSSNGDNIFHITNDSTILSGACSLNYLVNESMASNPTTGTLYGSGTSWNSSGYLVLTQAANSQCGYIDYQSTIPTNFDVSFDFWMGPNNPGADSAWFYWGSSWPPCDETDYKGGYIAALDEYVGQGKPFRIGFSAVGDIVSTSGGSPYSDSSWHNSQIIVRGNSIIMKYDGNTVLNITDSTRTLGGNHFGFGARTGGLNNEHRVRNLNVVNR
ncbi:hypothetical protein HGB24_01720 [Candidatus Saccharibacteria bacterium]|nr:hypothetical protein [Candidatus Saccharibacteria bacterium]